MERLSAPTRGEFLLRCFPVSCFYLYHEGSEAGKPLLVVRGNFFREQGERACAPLSYGGVDSTEGGGAGAEWGMKGSYILHLRINKIANAE